MLLDQLLTALDVHVQGFAICEVSPGWRLVFGRDDAPTVHYALRGSGLMRTSDGRSFPLDQDSFIVLPRLIAHSFEPGGGSRHEAHARTAAADFAQGLRTIRAGDGEAGLVTACGAIRASYGGTLDLFDRLSEPIIVDFSETQSLRGTFQMLLEELSAPAVGTRALTESLLKQCLVLFLRRLACAEGSTLPWLAALNDPHLARAVAVMIERPADPLTLAGLAEIAGLGRSAFTKRFHSAFGKSPTDFLTETRLRLAARLLETTDLPVKAVAIRVGYSSRSYFSRAFRQLFGLDPTGFRASVLAGPGRIEAPPADYNFRKPRYGDIGPSSEAC